MMLRQRCTRLLAVPPAVRPITALWARPGAARPLRLLDRSGRDYATGADAGSMRQGRRGPVLATAAAVLAGAGAAFEMHRRLRPAFALQTSYAVAEEEGEGDEEGYERLAMDLTRDYAQEAEDDGEEDLADAIVFEPEEEVKEEDKEEDKEKLLPASRILGVGHAKVSSEEDEARRQQLEAQIREHTRSWSKFEMVVSSQGDDDDDEEEDDEASHAPAKITLRYPPWLQPDEGNEVAQFVLHGMPPRGALDGYACVMTLLSTTPPVHHMRDLYEFHRSMRAEIGKQARIVKPRMRWLVSGRPAIGFITAFHGMGKTLVSTYVITPYKRRGYVLVFNSLHDGETPLQECLARHQLESDDAFDYILRSVTLRTPSPSPLPPSPSWMSPAEPGWFTLDDSFTPQPAPHRNKN